MFGYRLAQIQLFHVSSSFLENGDCAHLLKTLIRRGNSASPQSGAGFGKGTRAELLSAGSHTRYLKPSPGQGEDSPPDASNPPPRALLPAPRARRGCWGAPCRAGHRPPSSTGRAHPPSHLPSPNI